MKTWGDEQQIQWDKYSEGEQVILIINGEDDTIKAGDMVRIKNAFTEAALSVEIGAVYYCGNEIWDNFLTNTYLMVGSRALADKIAENEGKKLKYNINIHKILPE